MKERNKNKKKEYLRRTIKQLKNQTILLGSYQSYKHLNCSPCKIPETILEVDERNISTNGPENKKTSNDAEDFTSQR